MKFIKYLTLLLTVITLFSCEKSKSTKSPEKIIKYERIKDLSEFENEEWYRYYSSNKLDSAEILLEKYVIDNPNSLPELAYYAETLSRLKKPILSDLTANNIITLNPDFGWAYSIKAGIRNKQYRDNTLTNQDSSMSYYTKAVNAKTPDVSSWEVFWIKGVINQDTALEHKSLEALYKANFYEKSLVEYARWVLNSLPENALLLTSGDSDTYPFVMVQMVENIRPDIAIVNTSLLNLLKYRDSIEKKYGFVNENPKEYKYQYDNGYVYHISHYITMEWINRINTGNIKRELCSMGSVFEYYPKPLKEDVAKRLENRGFYKLYKSNNSKEVTVKELNEMLSNILSKDIVGPYLSPKNIHSPVMLLGCKNGARYFDGHILGLAVKVLSEYYKTNENSMNRVIEDVDNFIKKTPNISSKSVDYWIGAKKIFAVSNN